MNLNNILKRILVAIKNIPVRWVKDICQVFGISIFGIGFAALIGYLTNEPFLYVWVNGTAPISIPASIAVVLTGLSLLLIGHRLSKVEKYTEQHV